MDTICINYNILCNELIKYGQQVDGLKNFFNKNYPNLDKNQVEEILNQIRKRFISKFKIKWKSCNRKRNRFFDNNHEWLKGGFVVTFKKTEGKYTNIYLIVKNY